MGYNLLINGVYWGHNPLTNHLLTSWDIQVEGFEPTITWRAIVTEPFPLVHVAMPPCSCEFFFHLMYVGKMIQSHSPRIWVVQKDRFFFGALFFNSFLLLAFEGKGIGMEANR